MVDFPLDFSNCPVCYSLVYSHQVTDHLRWHSDQDKLPKVVGIVGPMGPPGPPGAQGPTGPPGPPGVNPEW